MFKLATLLALGTAYLLMFAWIDEVSAVNATVNRPASPKDVQVKGVSSETRRPKGADGPFYLFNWRAGQAIPRISSNANSGTYYLFWKPGKTQDSGQMSTQQSVFSYRPVFQWKREYKNKLRSNLVNDAE